MDATEKLAYLAGVFDGEGCVGIDGKYLTKVSLTITNASEELMVWLVAYFGGSVRERFDERLRADGSSRRRLYEWRFHGGASSRKTQVLLKSLLLFSIVKRPQLQIALQLSELVDCGSRGSHNGVSAEISAKRIALKKLIQKINRNGV